MTATLNPVVTNRPDKRVTNRMAKKTENKGNKEVTTNDQGSRSQSKATKPIRIYVEVADLALALAPLYGKKGPEFVSDCLLECLQKKLDEAPEKLRERIKGLVEQSNDNV